VTAKDKGITSCGTLWYVLSLAENPKNNKMNTVTTINCNETKHALDGTPKNMAKTKTTIAGATTINEKSANLSFIYPSSFQSVYGYRLKENHPFLK